MKKLVAIVTGFCVLAAAALPAAGAQLAGGWSAASVKDKVVVQAAEFAVKAAAGRESR